MVMHRIGVIPRLPAGEPGGTAHSRTIPDVHPAFALLDGVGGFATTRQLLSVMTRQELDVQVRNGGLVRVWYGVYGATEPGLFGRLSALDVFMGTDAVACLGTAAALYGFDVQNTTAVHVLDPGVRMRPTVGLMVHQRVGAPIQRVAGRLATTPAWTAVELARQLPRPRALATLDSALHSSWCTRQELAAAIDEQRGRRGIVAVRALFELADGRAESAMESEARLVMIDGGLPRPELQYTIAGRYGEVWRVDFAWPEARVAAEYDSIDWHAGRAEMLRDRSRFAAIQELGWIVVPIVVSDVRVSPQRLTDRIARHLARRVAA
jgi:very-short-patch-repair endonuclease